MTQIDPILASLAERAERGEGTYPVTLTVHGVIIFGTIVSSKAFAEDFAKQTGVSVGSAISGEGFIHLEGAQVYQPGGPMPRNGVIFWRGKLSEVDGFSADMSGG
jgi:hypothetical protein